MQLIRYLEIPTPSLLFTRAMRTEGAPRRLRTKRSDNTTIWVAMAKYKRRKCCYVQTRLGKESSSQRDIRIPLGIRIAKLGLFMNVPLALPI